ncbi:uncharacterized protein TM35_000074100 [Trypanosoma theileri]|uniref:Uncharacterized protein n=1 Tax=Trypanosoma theileri TaxID=67003 RepID=A0A1X0P210_9TRYP|nr:uncharacterized protein TM35_000074100 [Trypanosoma theileri]ORC90986.1 hypothetical protein TM35_000074100 [Trypanosoma theileri]
MLTFDKLPLALGSDHNEALEDTVDNVLANSHSVLTTTRRMSEAGLDSVGLVFKHTNFDFRPAATHGVEFEGDSFPGAVGALRAQLEECRAVLRRVESERRYLRARAAELQRGVAAAEGQRERLREAAATAAREAREARRAAAAGRRRLREAEAAAMTATEEQMRLRRYVRAAPFTPADARAIVPDRRFEEAFRDKMDAIRYKRRYQRAKLLHQQRAEAAERERMEAEDDADDTSNGLNASSTVTLAAMPATPNTNLSSSFNGLSLSQLGSTSISTRELLGGSFQLPFVHTTPRDSYVLALIQKASSSEALTRLRDGIIRICSRLKQGQDHGMRSLYTLMLECMRVGDRLSGAFFTDPKKSFEIVVEKTQRTHRDLLYDLLELVNSAVIDVAEMESSSTKKKVTKHNAGCSVYFPGVPDLRLADIEERLETQRQKQNMEASICKNTSTTTAGKPNFPEELHCMRPECTSLRQKTLFTLEQLLCLHKAFYKTVDFVHSYYAPTDMGIEDTFKGLNIFATEATLENPRFETKVAEAVEADIQQADKITECIVTAAKTPSSGASKHKTSMSSSYPGPRSEQQQQQQQQQQHLHKLKEEPRQMFQTPKGKVNLRGKSRGHTSKLAKTPPIPSKEAPYFARRFIYAKTEDINDTTLVDTKQSQVNSPHQSITQLNVTEPERPSTSIVPHANTAPPRSSESQPARSSIPREMNSPLVKPKTLTKVNLPQFMGKTPER